MPVEEIADGLKYAVSKGEPLEKAMMSFFNAGYPKQEIEQAARSLNLIQTQAAPGQPQPTQQGGQQPQGQQGPVQRVSSYGKKPSQSGKAITMILGFVLILLLGILVSVFLFRQEISDFLTNILS